MNSSEGNIKVISEFLLTHSRSFSQFFNGHYDSLLLINEKTILTIPIQMKKIPNFNNMILTIGQF